MAGNDGASLHGVITDVKRNDDGLREATGNLVLFDNQINCEFLTAEQAASYLKVSLKSLFNMTSNGTIPCYKLGRRNRYSLEDLRSLLKPKGKGG
jgi:excisionase family DNA binding protein